jgi:hypothetical protein
MFVRWVHRSEFEMGRFRVSERITPVTTFDLTYNFFDCKYGEVVVTLSFFVLV